MKIAKYFLIGTLLVFTSCNKELTIYEKFANRFKEIYPNGYDAEAKWYENQTIAISYGFNESEKTITSRNFIGYVDFDKKDFRGITTKFEITKNVTEISNGRVISYRTFYSCLNEGNYYSVEEIKYEDESKNTKLTKGCKNMNYINVSSGYDSNFYAFTIYDYLATPNSMYESINIYDDHVVFNKNFYRLNCEIIKEKIEYYFDENLEVNEIILYKDSVFDENDPYVIENNLQNEKSTQHLRLSEEKEINVPTEYDEEQEYDEFWSFIFI